MQHTARCIKKATPKSSLHHVPSPNTRWLCNPASYSPQLTTPLWSLGAHFWFTARMARLPSLRTWFLVGFLHIWFPFVWQAYHCSATKCGPFCAVPTSLETRGLILLCGCHVHLFQSYRQYKDLVNPQISLGLQLKPIENVSQIDTPLLCSGVSMKIWYEHHQKKNMESGYGGRTILAESHQATHISYIWTGGVWNCS